jgi:hypothetical protein
MSDLVIQHDQTKPLVSVFDQPPDKMIEYFTKMAKLLAKVIDDQGMYSVIQGKKYVKVDAWLTLGTMLGIMPREKCVTEQADGSYIAEVELINFKTGMIVGGASSLCSIDEKRWGNADKYARRSMAVTRATGKSYRLAFSWVIMMAGFQATPEEEMPVMESSHPTVAKTATVEIYEGTTEQEEALAGYLEKQGVNPFYFEKIGAAMVGKPKSAIRDVMAAVVK